MRELIGWAPVPGGRELALCYYRGMKLSKPKIINVRLRQSDPIRLDMTIEKDGRRYALQFVELDSVTLGADGRSMQGKIKFTSWDDGPSGT